MRLSVLFLALFLALPAFGAKGRKRASSRSRSRAQANQGQSTVTRAPQGVGSTKGTGAPNGHPDRKLNVAVLDIDALGLPRDMRESLVLLLRNTFNTMELVQMVSPVDIQIALQDPKNGQTARCEGGPACAVKVGKLVGADVVVYGNISAIGDAFSLNLRALDVKRNAEVGRQKAQISDRDALIPEMRLAAYRLIAPDRITGALLVEIDVAGVVVELDGSRLGVTPFAEPFGGLTPGEHYVVLQRPGYSEFKQALTIRAFETTKLKLQLRETQDGEQAGEGDGGEGRPGR